MKIKIELFKDELMDSIDAGIYEISIIKDNKEQSIYIGESVSMLERCAQHLYEFKNEPEYLGFSSNQLNELDLTLRFKILKKEEKQEKRKRKEKAYIKKRNPLCQSGVSDRMKTIKNKIKAVEQFINNN